MSKIRTLSVTSLESYFLERLILIRFIPVNNIPDERKNSKKKDIRGMLDMFINENVKYAQIFLDDEDYCRPDAAMQSIRIVGKRHNYPVAIKTRRGFIYISRTDMEE